MSNKKRLMYCLIAGIVLGNIVFWTNRCSHAEVAKVERDTVVVYDTIPDYNPKPKDSIVTKYVTRYLPVHSTDTVDRYITMTDTVAVQVPITSKHYSGKNYDAYVSGFEPNLDSIFVYNETQLITETITRMKPPNKWSLSVNAGIDYGVKSKFWQPFASGELTINNDKRLQWGIEGGMRKSELTNDFEPFGEVKIKVKVF